MPENHDEKLTIYKRRLPHWCMSGAVYFITWRLFPTQPELMHDERSVVASALKHFDGSRYALFAYVVMHNHVYVLVEAREKYPLQDIVHSWKSYTANSLQREFGRKDRIWQDEYFDRIVRDEGEFLQKAQYILNNPWKTWPEIKEYQWVGFKEAGTEARPTIPQDRSWCTEKLS
jgi:REP element-mobilizing transposase RayT